MKKVNLIFSMGIAVMLIPAFAFCGELNTDTAQRVTYPHDFSLWNIPAKSGDATWFDDNGLYKVDISFSSVHGYADLTVDGTPTGTLSPDGATVYKTNNPGIGIAYQLNYSSPDAFSPSYGLVYPNTITITSESSYNGYMHIKYQLVRLTDKVPAGAITQVPTVTLNYHNPPGGQHGDMSFVALSGVSAQPKITACGIDAPTEITLPTLYGNTIRTGALNPTAVPTVTLTNCPGAVNGISYNFSAVYGAHSAAEGVLNTVTGDGYATGVYVQVQNADGSPHIVNAAVPLSDYNGSGDYKIPDFKVAYFVDDADSVRPGNVKSAIELKVTYN
ncbi:fimbrial protein [Enterobacter quasiroggenkampii]|uniref:fimbrial protein n=1 Tax=Enterobacter quasiroggenkampii TaxID=2497436 RepID=UPI001F28DEFE|nr:fimbrial protein [Enterobacter quasiroggenkampii]